MTPTQLVERLTAEERREQILKAAITVFAEHGYEAASTDEIARRVGISQPYLFRLYRTKRELVLACIERCFLNTAELFERAARGHSGQDALNEIGAVYAEMIRSDPIYLRAQLQSYAACEDPEIRDLVSSNFGVLVDLVGRLSGVDSAELSRFFATGMLLNVLASMRQLDTPRPWAVRLIEGCVDESVPAEKRAALGPRQEAPARKP